MTSLLVRPDHPGADTARPRPLVLVTTAAGAFAALGPLLVLLALGVIGWFLSDAGAHGAPRGGMRVGALGWLAAHGSGLSVDGVRVTVVPLGLTLLCGWVMWRTALRAGEALADHGPDEASRSDGERDWTLPMAILLFFAGYAVVAVLTASLAASPDVAPSVPRVLAAALLLTLVVASPALALGSGRSQGLLHRVPPTARVALRVALAIVLAVVAVSTVVFLASLLWSFSDAATMTARLHPSPGETALFTLVNAAYLPNAVLFASSWLLGPGFTIGAGTLVTPGAVVLGPLPLFPLLAALPADGPQAAWLMAGLALPPLAAGVAAIRVLRRYDLPWDQLTLAACVGGIIAGFGLVVATAFAGGAAGPGRMSHIGPVVGDVLVHAVTSCAIGALLGSLLLLGWRALPARRDTEAG